MSEHCVRCAGISENGTGGLVIKHRKLKMYAGALVTCILAAAAVSHERSLYVGEQTEFTELLDSVPEFSGEPYVEVNGNVPYFTDEEREKGLTAFEEYGELDSLGRCTAAFASICLEIMPTEERGKIGDIKPTGWYNKKYPGIISDLYLYNRCHLIGYQLSGENANEKNLITGTRYLNITGMQPFEDYVDDYVEDTGNHVLYRVTPIFEGDNLVASGVLMEGESLEDSQIEYCIFAYNVQPGIVINYADGSSYEEKYTEQEAVPAASPVSALLSYLQGMFSMMENGYSKH